MRLSVLSKKYHSFWQYLFALLMFTVFLTVNTFAQEAKHNDTQQVWNRYSLQNKNQVLYDSLFIIQYRDKNCLQDASITFLRQLSDNMAIISTNNIQFIQSLTKTCIDTFAFANNYWKLADDLELMLPTMQKHPSHLQAFVITSTNLSSLLQQLQQKKINFKIIKRYPSYNTAIIECTQKVFLSSLLKHPLLIAASKYVQPLQDLLVSGYIRNINQLNLAAFQFPNANGNGITIGIKERLMDENDIDLKKRILPSVLAASVKDYHASVSATLAAGAGNSFITGKGVATHSQIYPSSFSDLFPDSTELLLQNKVSVQNHAYGTIIQNQYGAEAMAYDKQTYLQKHLIHVFSSGNRGTASSTSGIYAGVIGYANLTGNFKMSKNVITVAAVDTGNNITAFSSAGPLFDGRLAPQLTALGPNGTSEAAALVSGAVAVLQQVYKENFNGNLPAASLVKAILYSTADDIGNKGIDYKTGFGLMNLHSALNAMRQQQFDSSKLQPFNTWSKTITVPPSAANLKVTLAYSDTAATVNTFKALVNDLDLELIDLQSGTVYLPWVLSPVPSIDSLSKLPRRRKDTLNTVEQVSIDLPAAGNYQIRVIAKDIKTTVPQDFLVAWYWDTLHQFRFTNPVQTTDIDRSENPILPIRWRTSLLDNTATGTLAVSFDNALTWKNIAAGIRLSQQVYHWALPDTATQMQLRMQTNFGVFYSEKLVLAPVTKLKIDYRCTDSLRLSWPSHIYAQGYTLFALGDTAYLKPVLQVADTFAILPTSIFNQQVWAVQPQLQQGLTAARSLAIDIRQQAVECFYKNLLALPAGDSIALELHLSYLPGIKLIEFEKVSVAGNRLQLINSTTVQSAQTVYYAADPTPHSGLNHYRVKLFIGNSAVYTYIVSVYHNGNLALRVYPSPVKRGQPIQFRIKEAMGDVYVEVRDLTGKLVLTTNTSIAGSISTAPLAPGLYVLFIHNQKRQLIAAQKFIVQ